MALRCRRGGAVHSIKLGLRGRRPYLTGITPKADGVDGSRSRHQSATLWKRSCNHEQRESPAMEITTVGLDLAKRVFQVHAVGGSGEVVVRKTLRRAQMIPYFAGLEQCLVCIEACGTSHYWAREIGKLGHEVRLMPPAYVKPYVKRGKTDASDAEAICEAVRRPTMRSRSSPRSNRRRWGCTGHATCSSSSAHSWST